MFDGLTIVVTGGTGSIGSELVRRLLSGVNGHPARVIVLSRDEGKQHLLRQALLRDWEQKSQGPDPRAIVRFVIGDVAEYSDVVSVLHNVDVVFHAAAMKQVPTAEYFPAQAIRTNVLGAENLVRAIREHRFPVRTVVGVSTDKACQPVNVMGMTKALQERIFIQANLDAPDTRFVIARFGNVLATRGSVIPIFIEQARNGGPLTVTTPAMTRFLMSIGDAVTCLLDTYRLARPGEVMIPRLRSARLLDIARAVMGSTPVPITYTGIRPGEKLHERLIAAEEAHHTVCRDNMFAIQPMLHELVDGPSDEEPGWEFGSEHKLMDVADVRTMLFRSGLLETPTETPETQHETIHQHS